MKHFNKMALSALALATGFLINQPLGHAINRALFLPSIEERFDEMLGTSPSGRYLSALKEYYPQDFEELRAKIIATVESGYDPARARRELTMTGLRIRARHASAVRKASDETLRRIIRMNLTVAVQLRDDPMLCNRFLASGLQGLPEDRRAALEDDFDVTLFLGAAHEGETDPVARGRITREDVRALAAAFVDAGGTAAELAVLNPFDPEDPDACAAGLRFLRVLSDADFPNSDRLRAEMAVSIAST